MKKFQAEWRELYLNIRNRPEEKLKKSSKKVKLIYDGEKNENK